MLPANMNKNTMIATNIADRNRSLVLATALVAVVVCASYTTQAQNWVPNPGFEETDSCTFGLGLGELHHWHSAFGTPDHLQSCQPYGTVNGLPLNLFTYQQPFEANSCAGIFTFDGNTGTEYREWIMAALLEPLVVGHTYYCSFWANAAFGGTSQTPQNWLASDHLGMLFTTYDRQWIWGDPYPTALNQAHILHPQILSDTAGWTLVSGNFVADSAYTYLMIGNFYSNALTDTTYLAAGVPLWGRYSYVLLDAVCASPIPDGCELSQDVEESGEARPFVYPNPASDALVIGNAKGRDALMLNMLGQQVWRGRMNNDRFPVDVESWARGAYVLQVRGTRGVQLVKFVLAE